ncbi:2-succinyl-5-enolpyruvyl-6-hydroxy-3-cyclohexene-1-carboxylic-acid synthase, partial [Bacteroides fragilis]
MYSDKKNILQLVALLRAHGVTKVVLCPGSRNAPIVHTLAGHPDFTCYSVTDERSAGFFAIGLALQGGTPAAVCCTSGTALLNLHPAIAEAYYQKVSLVVISADRPAAWINQMDGQTLPQPGVFRSLVKKSVDLPEIHTDEDEWYCNRLLNEALLELNHHGKGPVHINVPVSEPLFQFTAESLPEVRVITRYQGLNVYDRDYDGLIDRLNKYNRRMMIVGQMNLIYLFEKKYSKMLYK